MKLFAEFNLFIKKVQILKVERNKIQLDQILLFRTKLFRRSPRGRENNTKRSDKIIFSKTKK